MMVNPMKMDDNGYEWDNIWYINGIILGIFMGCWDTYGVSINRGTPEWTVFKGQSY